VQATFQADLLGDREPGGSLVDAWRELAEIRENPFLTPEWFLAWMAENPDEEPWVIVCRDGEEVRGVVPLVRVRNGASAVLRFAGARRGDWFTPACRVEDERAVGAACATLLRSERGAWHQLVLDRVDDASEWPQALWADGVERAVAPGPPRRVDALPYVGFGEDGYAGYLAARSRNFRSQLGRRRRKLEREHGLSFRMTTEASELEADFDVFYRLHDERWEERGGSSSSGDEVRRMQRRFAAAALERGWLRLWIAEADGEPRAAWYGWRLGDRYCYSLSGLASEYESFALGTVLLAHTIEQAAEEGATVYDLMWGDESYKSRFETGQRATSSWTLGRRGHPLGLAAGAHARLERVARRVSGKW
jgi:CelD/BcsL family acetyltransferase involved in cellulose biosynthesis